MPTRPPNARAKRQRQVRKDQNKRVDRRRGSASSRGYDSRWARSARLHLDGDPLCRYCDLVGRLRPATLVDHLYPHHGDQQLFWDERWWVSSCKPCHDGPKQRLEAAGIDAIHLVADQLGLERLAA